MFLDTFLLVVCLLLTMPVLAFKKTRTVSPITFFLFVAYFLMYRETFFLDRITAGDTHYNLARVALMLSEWLISGNKLGWLPYMGGGMPMSVFNNQFSHFLPVLTLVLNNKLGLFPTFEGTVFFGLLVTYAWSGLGIFFLVWQFSKDRSLALLGLLLFLFSDLPSIEIDQAAYIWSILFLSWVAFFFLRYWKEGHALSFVGFCLSLGFSTHLYIPIFIPIICCLFFVSYISLAPHTLGQIKAKAFPLLAKKTILFLGILLFIGASAPMFHFFLQKNNFVSPTRGFHSGTVSSTNYGAQAPTATLLSNYNVLLIPWQDTQGANYLGMVPLLLFFMCPLGTKGHKTLFLVTVFCFFLSLGKATPLWFFLVDHIPPFNQLRHSYHFGRATWLLMLVGAMAGLKIFLDPVVNSNKKLFTLFIGFCFIYIIYPSIVSPNDGTRTLWLVIVLTLMSVVAFAISINLRSVKIIGVTLLVLAIFAEHLVEINKIPNVFQPNKHPLFETPQFEYKPERYFPKNALLNVEPRPIEYPNKWSYYSKYRVPQPFDFTPLIYKELIWSYPSDQFVFFIQKDFAELYQKLHKPDEEVAGLGGDLFEVGPANLNLEYLNNRFGLPNPVPAPAPAPEATTQPQIPIEIQYDSSDSVTDNLPSFVADSNLDSAWSGIDPGSEAELNAHLTPSSKISKVKLLAPTSGLFNFTWEYLKLFSAKSDGTRTPLAAKVVHANNSQVELEIPNPVLTSTLVLSFRAAKGVSIGEMQLEQPVEIIPKIVKFTPLTVPPPKINSEIQPIASTNPNFKAATVTLDQSGTLVRYENFDTGWSVKVDGVSSEIKKLPYNLQGVALEKGTHLVEFTFTNWYNTLFWISATLHLFALPIFTFLIWYRSWERTTEPNQADA